MPKTNHVHTSYTAIKEEHRNLVVGFLADLLQSTGTPDRQEHFQATRQTYCDTLRPWLDPSRPLEPRVIFSLLEEYRVDVTGDTIAVVLSPEGEAFFRAWLRRNESWSNAGLHTPPVWSH